MELDNNWLPPPGMVPMLNYPDGVNGVTVVGVAYINTDGAMECTNDWPCFEVGKNHEHAPALPLKKFGEIWHVGWDIPTRFAIDAKNTCYIDNAHGHPMHPTSTSDFLKMIEESFGPVHIESSSTRTEIYGLLGLPVPQDELAKLKDFVTSLSKELCAGNLTTECRNVTMPGLNRCWPCQAFVLLNGEPKEGSSRG